MKVLILPCLTLLSSRSTKGIKRLSSKERALFSIPKVIKEILVGMLLGDSHIARRSPTANSRLVFSTGQTAVKHKEYFEYVFSFVYLFLY